MFWHSAANSNSIDNLLDQPDTTLTTILDQDEVLMEIRGMNKKLLEFLTRKDSIHEMLDLITTVPSPEIAMAIQYKFPNTACEVLTSDISFAEKIAAEEVMMKKLFHFFRDAEPPLNPLLASFVCRVMAELICRKVDQNWYSYQLNLIQVMGYLQSEPNLLSWLMKHLETTSVCDFLHKLVMNVEGQDIRHSLFQWLEVKENFLLKLVHSMDKVHNKETHQNVSRLVGDLLFALQDETSFPSQDRIDPEPFLLALKSHTIFERLLDVIFNEETMSQSSIVYGLDMTLGLLGIVKKPTKLNMKVDTMYETNDDIYVPAPFRATLGNRMITLMRFLQCPLGPGKPIKLSNGVLHEPLGQERLAIVKFVANVLTLHDVELNEMLIHCGVLTKAMDLLWDHPWNNFLHHYVCQIVIQMSKFTRSNNCAKFLYIDYALPERIMEAFEDEDLKVGYLGHLAKMAGAMNTAMDENETVKTIFPEMTQLKPELRRKFKEFIIGKWMAYMERATQLLAGAALPSSGVPLPSTQHNYDSDPGVTWDSSSGIGLSTDNDNSDFFEASTNANFGGTDRYDDEKSKTIFEMFCFDRSNSGDDDDDNASFNRNEDNSMSFGNTESEAENPDYQWRDPNMFFKQMEEQEEMFGQLALNNGSLGGNVGNVDSSASSGEPNLPSSFIANPWAGQESVQVSAADPWAAFDFSENAVPSTQDNEDSSDWARFDQSFLVSTVTPSSATTDLTRERSFGNISSDPDVFQQDNTTATSATSTPEATASQSVDEDSPSEQSTTLTQESGKGEL